MSLAAGTIANSFEFTQRLLQARSAEELVQLQAEFAEAQMHAWADQTRELGQTVARTATDAMKTTVGSMQSAGDWNRIQGNWKQLKGKVKEKWGKLTADDLDTIEGRRDQLEGKIQDRYGYTADQVRRAGVRGVQTHAHLRPDRQPGGDVLFDLAIRPVGLRFSQ